MHFSSPFPFVSNFIISNNEFKDMSCLERQKKKHETKDCCLVSCILIYEEQSCICTFFFLNHWVFGYHDSDKSRFDSDCVCRVQLLFDKSRFGSDCVRIVQLLSDKLAVFAEFNYIIQEKILYES